MTNHIPGPWMFDEEDNTIQHVESRMVIATVSDIEDFPCRDQDLDECFGEELVDCGNLIAAAPDLLAVLAEYLVLGAGKCTIGKPLADKALAAVKLATEGR